ncbi:hypothetical protein BD324DRAFT_655817 [Kockovaella imperatae]|uniref:Uncharacterized protein n=1 Tax=Kockovaella imperatae TaxID=4999 RepID=A0A1Y1UM29_9TREE|nr:hypothetical protein BD324DRAFT_655817 [Kockovaella imperatae]ORX38544.1 hypothetical protein BD324DRAFT_655817 [Kockovaella imperatae]
MRQYMIRRFPLVFDAQLQKHASAFQIHRSIPDSVERFLRTSRAHDATLSSDGQKMLNRIQDSGNSSARATLAARFSVSSKKRPEIATGGDETLKKKRHRLVQETQAVLFEEREDEVEEYFKQLQGGPNEEQRSSPFRSMSQPAQIDQLNEVSRLEAGLVLAQAFAKIGRVTWEEARKGRNRIALSRLKFAASKLTAPGEELSRDAVSKDEIAKIPSVESAESTHGSLRRHPQNAFSASAISTRVNDNRNPPASFPYTREEGAADSEDDIIELDTIYTSEDDMIMSESGDDEIILSDTDDGEDEIFLSDGESPIYEEDQKIEEDPLAWAFNVPSQSSDSGPSSETTANSSQSLTRIKDAGFSRSSSWPRVANANVGILSQVADVSHSAMPLDMDEEDYVMDDENDEDDAILFSSMPSPHAKAASDPLVAGQWDWAAGTCGTDPIVM